MTDTKSPAPSSDGPEDQDVAKEIAKLREQMPDMTVVQNVPLAFKPTPLQDLPLASEALGIRVRVKRDDLTGSHVSGNKIRKLEYLTRHALAQGATHIVTTGGIQSNHCRATAFAAREVGMTPVLLLRTPNGEASDLPVPANGNVFLDQLAGAEIRTCTPEQYQERDSHMAAIAEELKAEGHTPYVIPEGGSNALGALGYVACAHEIVVQCGDKLPATVVCAVGSGGTVAGLALGFKHLNLGIRVLGVPVCDDGAYFHKRVMAIAAAASAKFGLAELEDKDFGFIDGYQGRGYALSTAEELALIRDVARRDGIVLDPVYTGKAFKALVEVAQQDSGARLGGDTVFVHTGGIFGLLAKADEFVEHGLL